MSMESTAWTQLYSVMNAQQERRPFDRVTLRRIGAFARPHRRRIALFVLLGVASARLAGATPVHAGRVGATKVWHRAPGPGGRRSQDKAGKPGEV
ncbi:hypothetical protein ACFWDQ_00275, partial [Streptomyces sp. NPDC060053]